MASQGWVTFPGVETVVEASINFVHGISPSVATLTIAPQANFIAEGGTLEFHYDNRVVAFPECKVDYNSLQRTDQGEVWQLAIFDRRWKWKFGAISGAYNLKAEDGSLKQATEKTPHQLATLCLQAMGEGKFTLAGLPNEPRPEVNWDFELPAEALAQLCELLGCHVVLGLDNQVYICKVGEGEELPTDGALENSLTINPPEKPDGIAVVCGLNRYQVDFELEAVGEDVDGTIQLINSLSYVPAAGWGDFDDFTQVSATSGEVARDLAIKTVGRWYRVKTPVEVPGFGRVNDLDHLAIETEQVDTVTISGTKRNIEPWVYGIWFGNPDADTGNSVGSISPVTGRNDTQIVPYSYSIDTRQAIVRFSDVVVKNTGTSPVVFGGATLRLRTACNVRDRATWGWVRYFLGRKLDGRFNTPHRHIFHDEIVLSITPSYNANFGIVRTSSNINAVQEEARHYLDAIEREYDQTYPQVITYIGLRNDVGLDGAIQQITYNLGRGGFTTTIARNTEILHWVLPFRERRRIEKQKSEFAKEQALKSELKQEMARDRRNRRIGAV